MMSGKRWGLALLLLIVAALAAFPVSAQGDPEQAVEQALADLNERLGETLTLDDLESFSWTETEFGDASLGCPQEGQMYAQVITPGYVVVLTHAGTTYDYRVAADGSQLLLCGSASTQDTVTEAEGGDPLATGAPITVETAVQVTELAQVNTGDGTTGAAIWSSGGDALAAAAAGEAGGVLIFTPTAPDAEPVRLDTGEPVTALDFGSSGGVTFLATGGLNGGVRFFQVVPPGLDAIVMQTEAAQAVNGVAVSPDLLLVASSTSSDQAAEGVNAVNLWSTRTGTLLSTIDNNIPVTSVAFGPVADAQGRWLLALGYQSGAVDLYAIRVTATEEQVDVEWEHLLTASGHGDAVRDLAFRADGAQVASASLDGTVRLWNTAAEGTLGAELGTLQTDLGAALGAAFSADGSLLAVAGGDPNAADAASAIQLWNIVVPQDASVMVELAAETTVNSVAFSPDGFFLLSSSEDGLRLWGVPTNPSGDAPGQLATEVAPGPVATVDVSELTNESGAVG